MDTPSKERLANAIMQLESLKYAVNINTSTVLKRDALAYSVYGVLEHISNFPEFYKEEFRTRAFEYYTSFYKIGKENPFHHKPDDFIRFVQDEVMLLSTSFTNIGRRLGYWR